MPLTCEFNGADFDSTDCTDVEWSGIYKTLPRGSLTCRECGYPMHAKMSSSDLRFFAHHSALDDERPTCESDGESPEHMMLKKKIASIVRLYGWSAEVEASPRDGDLTRWRADVLATNSDGSRQIAFEIQLSAMSIPEGKARTERYLADSIEAVWITNRTSAKWFARVPSLRIDNDMDVIGGLAQFLSDAWKPWFCPLDDVLRGILNDTIANEVVPTTWGTEHCFALTTDLSAYGIYRSVDPIERRNDALNEVMRLAAERESKMTFQTRPFCPVGRMWLGRRDDQQLDVGDPCPYCSTTLESRASVN